MAHRVWFQTGVAVILTLIIIWLIMQVGVIFQPIGTIITTVFIPILIGGLFFYITEPIKRFFERRGLNRIISILTVIIIIFVVVAIFMTLLVPVISDQIRTLVEMWPRLQRDFLELLDVVLLYQDDLPFDPSQMIDQGIEQVTSLFSGLAGNIFSILSGTVSVLLTIVLIPFFYFFMMKDHERLVPALLSPFGGTFKQFLSELLHDIDKTLRAFIQGQLLVSTILAILLFIGYSIIGLEYALLLAMLALVLNIIPFIGPWMAFIPAAILALIQDPWMLVWVSIITLIAQQAESNLITPNVMGQSLQLHPLTVITVVLAAGNIGGFIGMLIAIPTYAIIKVIVINIWRYRTDFKQSFLRKTE